MTGAGEDGDKVKGPKVTAVVVEGADKERSSSQESVEA